MYKKIFLPFVLTFISFLCILSSCSEPNVVENQTNNFAKDNVLSLGKNSDIVKPIGKIIGYKVITENGKEKKIPIYDGIPDGIEQKALTCDYYSIYFYELNRFQSVPGKWLGIWTSLKTKYDLYHKYGFNQYFVQSYQDKQQAISVGYKVDSLMGGINFSPQSVEQYGYLGYYHLDEPIEENAYPTDIRLIGQYVNNAYPNSLVMMSSYRYHSDWKWYNPPIGRLEQYIVLYKDETMDLASNIKIMCDKYHDAFMNPIDQRSYWTNFKTYYSNKNVANWIHLKEDSYSYGDGQFEQLLEHANNKGIKNIWVYAAFSGYSGLVEQFCNSAWKKGWLRKFVNKYKYMYHCPEYLGDPCYCSENDAGWELAWIQFLGTEEVHY